MTHASDELRQRARREYAQGRLDQFLRMKNERPIDPTYWDMHEERRLREALSESAGAGSDVLSAGSASLDEVQKIRDWAADQWEKIHWNSNPKHAVRDIIMRAIGKTEAVCSAAAPDAEMRREWDDVEINKAASAAFKTAAFFERSYIDGFRSGAAWAARGKRRQMKLDDKVVAARIKGEQARTLANIAARTEPPAGAYWLSFADDDGFRGAVIVHAEDFTTALMECNLRNINPHGEVQGMPIPPEIAAAIPDKWKNRVLRRNECAEFDKEMARGKRSAQ